MLPRKQGRRDQNRDLLAVLNRLERGTHGNLSLTEAHVAGNQAVHRDLGLHILLDLIDGGQLIRGLNERERCLKLGLPRSVRRERVPAGGHPSRIQLDQFARDLPDRTPRLRLRLRPIRAAHLGQRRLIPTHVPRDLIQLIRRNKQPVPRRATLGRRVFDHQILAHRPCGLALLHLDETSDAVLIVHNIVAFLQGQRVNSIPTTRSQLLRGPRHSRARATQHVCFREERKLHIIQHKAVAGERLRHLDQTRPRRLVDRLDAAHGDIRIREKLNQTVRRARAIRDHNNRPVIPDAATHILEHLGDITTPRGRLTRRNPDRQPLLNELLIRTQRSHRPPRQAGIQNPSASLT